MTDGYVYIHLESRDNKHYHAIFEYELFTERNREGDRRFVELGNEMFTYVEEDYSAITYKKGWEYESPYLDELMFDTINEAYREIIIEIFLG